MCILSIENPAVEMATLLAYFDVVSRDRPFTQSLRRGKGLSNSGLVSTGPGISWTGNWFRVATSLYKQRG